MSFKYSFREGVDMSDVKASLVLALFAVESLHGESKVRLKASASCDANNRTCVIEGGNRVGDDLNQLFVGYLRRDFGDDAFHFEMINREEVSSE